MNGRIVAEVKFLAVAALWAYAITAVMVAAVGEGQAASFGAAAAVVVLSYGLGWALRRFDIGEQATRAWGAGLSILLLYLVLRIEIAGEPYLWELAWLPDLLSDPPEALEGHAGDVTETVLLGAVWLGGVVRAGRELTFEGGLAEVSFGLLVVLLAAAFASAADAPGAVRWLPVPYMAIGLLALAVMHLQSVRADRRRPFLGAWMLWVGGSLGGIAGLALLAAFFEPPSMEPVGHALAVAGQGIGVAVFYVLWPVFHAMVWVVQHVLDFVADPEPFTPEEPATDELMEELREKEREPAGWVEVLGRVLRFGLVAVVIALALGALWLAFRRLSRGRKGEDEVREEVEPGEGGPLRDLQSMLSGALGRLRGRPAARGYDAVGRLYFSVLARAEGQGLPRPPSATPLEFAPRLEAHFDSPVPGAVSDAYAQARYGGRPLPAEQIEELRCRWREVAGGRKSF